MSLPSEKRRALHATKEWMEHELFATGRVSRQQLTKTLQRLLRHWPTAQEIDGFRILGEPPADHVHLGDAP